MTQILIAEDDQNSRELLSGFLIKQGYDVRTATNGAIALDMIHAKSPDILILDRGMPDMDGIEVCKSLRGNSHHNLLYIIMLTAMATTKDKVEGLDEGADDYLTKPADLAELLARIRMGIRQIEDRRCSMFDGLTQVYNRVRFSQLMKQEIDKAKGKQQPLSLIFIDLDHFKSVNDTYGHHAGDDVLQKLGGLLNEVGKKGGIPARWGGEEFVLLLPDQDLDKAKETAEALREKISQTSFEGPDQVTASMGVADFQKHEQDLMERADKALYEAKSGGRNRVVLA